MPKTNLKSLSELLDAGHKLNVPKTLRRRRGSFLNALCMFNLRLASRVEELYKTKNEFSNGTSIRINQLSSLASAELSAKKSKPNKALIFSLTSAISFTKSMRNKYFENLLIVWLW